MWPLLFLLFNKPRQVGRVMPQFRKEEKYYTRKNGPKHEVAISDDLSLDFF
jgi:hypothetical protein